MTGERKATSRASPEGPGPQRSVVRRGLRHLAPFVLPRWTMLLVAAIALVTGTAFELLKPWPLKFVFDYLLKGLSFLPDWMVPPGTRSATAMLIVVCGLILALAVLSSTAAYFREYLLARVGEEVAFDLRVALFGHIQRLSLRFHDSRRLGDVITRVTGDIGAVRELATSALLQSVTALLTLLGMLIVMFAMDWQLALVAVCTIPVLCPVVWYYRGRIERASRQRRQREVEVASVTQETMSSIRLVRAFGREAHQQREFGDESSQSAAMGLEVARLEASYVRAVDIIGAAAACAVVWWGVHRVWAGSLTAGDLLVFAHYIRGIYGPLRELAKQSARVAKGKASLERVVEVLEMEPDIRESPSARRAPAFRGLIEFQHVCFDYQPGRPALTSVSFRVEPGQVVALVGCSGAGKSTILSLIPRLYDPTSGCILIDGADIRGFEVASLRDQISLVLQDSILLQTSIAENIMYGRHDATPAEVEAAALAAGVDQFVNRLPDRYQTVVGPRGATLSGGERQRVAVARAMVRGAPILLLDEPTTGLDVESEQLVMKALARLMRGRTTLLVSHRLQLVEQADEILVIDKGRIAESGSSAELIVAGGVYARLHGLAGATGVLFADERAGQLVELPRK